MNEQESVSENQELESDKERGREGAGLDEVEPSYLKNSLLWDTIREYHGFGYPPRVTGRV